MGFLGWLGDNSDSLTVLVSAGTLLVWLVYAQLLLANYQRQRTARIVISRGSHAGTATVIMIANMGEEPMFVVCLIAAVHTKDETFSRQITDSDLANRPDSADTLQQITSKGPLASGNVMTLGSFDSLLRHVTKGTSIAAPDEESEPQIEKIESVDLLAVFIYGPETHPVGARRRFRVDSEDGTRGGYAFVPTTLHTERFYSRRKRRVVREWLRDCI